MIIWKSLLVAVIITTFYNNVQSKKTLLLTKMHMCDPDYDYPMKFITTLKVRDKEEYVNITAILNEPLGQDQLMNATFEFSSDGKEYAPLFKFTRTNFCDFLNKDLGAFWFEIQKQIALPPRTCPIPVGRYNVKNYQLPFNKLNIPFPTGVIRSSIIIAENKSKKVLSCIFTLMETVG